MSLFSTKYPNNSRSVSGTVTVQDNDVILECVTLDGAVTVILPSIPSGNWNTGWELYVYDKSGNAATNNITIVAPTGFTINGASNYVVSVNSVRCKISISSNTSYLCVGSNIGGGVSQAYTTIQDEGSSLPQRSVMNFVGSGVSATDSGGVTVITITAGSGYSTIEDEGVAVTQRTTMNFVGAGVSVADSGGKTVITIVGGVVSITNANLLTAISNSTLVAGQFYLVTDGGNSNGGIIIQANSTNRVNMYGAAFFLNADYEAVGDYSSVTSAGSQLGIWSSDSLSVAINDFVVYDNSNYKNLTGSWGTAPSGDATNWAVLSKTITNGYILECDFVKYNVTTNKIEYRADKRGNEVDNYQAGLFNPILKFQWGRNKASFNRIYGNSSFNATNSCATFESNLLYSGIYEDTTSSVEAGLFKSNVITENGSYSCFGCRGEVSYNTFSQDCDVVISGVFDFNCVMQFNTIKSQGKLTFATVDSGSTISNNCVSSSGEIKSTGTCSGGTITKNNITTNGLLQFTSVTSATINGCQVSDGITVDLGATTTGYSYKKVYTGFSNWEQNLDFTTAFSAGTLTIPASYAYVGIFNCVNASANNISLIANAPTNHAYTLRPNSTSNFDFTSTAVGSGATNCILKSHASPPTPTTVTGRTNGGDELVLKRFGTYNGIIEFNIWR